MPFGFSSEGLETGDMNTEDASELFCADAMADAIKTRATERTVGIVLC